MDLQKELDAIAVEFESGHFIQGWKKLEKLRKVTKIQKAIVGMYPLLATTPAPSDRMEVLVRLLEKEGIEFTDEISKPNELTPLQDILNALIDYMSPHSSRLMKSRAETCYRKLKAVDVRLRKEGNVAT
jgi:hypothetical protein